MMPSDLTPEERARYMQEVILQAMIGPQEGVYVDPELRNNYKLETRRFDRDDAIELVQEDVRAKLRFLIDKLGILR